ncbi:hypothetical protein GLAREA_00859 [Glarea lozoyensis ATCC 20868]|uniref:Uncharacterized protein n=1 Tax=Glarea lozoyensis (strain ATCC 20868 / MF5171) TaxID=1116229 RepID=S3CXN9_GLAL2|nr:uncharacterized protein GLAREA_00859 [Glarea lozoyensis ATCC 20868]EPE29699.1 hypothetical protein GLAREA_00859 [Glarea lozoyensis ATCC 20868]
MHQLTGPNIPRRFAPMADGAGVLREAALLAGERLAARKTAGAWIPDALFRGRGDGIQTLCQFLVRSCPDRVEPHASCMYQKLSAGNHSTWTGSGDARFMNTKGNLLEEQESVSHDLASASSNKSCWHEDHV